MDFPLYPKQRQSLIFQYHGYKCRECGQYFTESIPEKIPHARISCRAAEWIKSLLSKNMSVSAVSEITGFHWETIKKIHLGIIDKFLKKRKDELFRSGYKPTYLAVILLSQFLVFDFLKTIYIFIYGSSVYT